MLIMLLTSAVSAVSAEVTGPLLSFKGSGLAHIIKKDRLSTRFFAAVFRVVAAVRFGNVPPCSLVVVPPSPSLR